MADIVVYRTYPFSKDGYDPVLDDVTEAIAKENLQKKLGIVKELSGVSSSTLRNWTIRKTRSPHYRTVAAVFTALGYFPQFKRTGKFDLDAERQDAKRWIVRREAAKLAAKTRRKNERKNNREDRPSA